MVLVQGFINWEAELWVEISIAETNIGLSMEFHFVQLFIDQWFGHLIRRCWLIVAHSKVMILKNGNV